MYQKKHYLDQCKRIRSIWLLSGAYGTCSTLLDLEIQAATETGTNSFGDVMQSNFGSSKF
jgi:hypothetical protein